MITHLGSVRVEREQDVVRVVREQVARPISGLVRIVLLVVLVVASVGLTAIGRDGWATLMGVATLSLAIASLAHASRLGTAKWITHHPARIQLSRSAADGDYRSPAQRLLVADSRTFDAACVSDVWICEFPATSHRGRRYPATYTAVIQLPEHAIEVDTWSSEKEARELASQLRRALGLEGEPRTRRTNVEANLLGVLAVFGGGIAYSTVALASIALMHAWMRGHALEVGIGFAIEVAIIDHLVVFAVAYGAARVARLRITRERRTA